MKTPFKPVHTDTIVTSGGHVWGPVNFRAFMDELAHIQGHCQQNDALVLFRGHRRAEWLLHSTFVRSCKELLFGVPPEASLSSLITNSVELHYALLNLYLLKYGVLVRPTSELEEISRLHGADSWFELMKRYQQYPKEDLSIIKGSHLLDWTLSANVALHFANDRRQSEGAVWICDASATGKIMQILPVGQILDKMKEAGNSGKALGIPLLFHPSKQIHNLRANNQEAVYLAQMDLRHDMASIWDQVERNSHNTQVYIKLIIPSGTQRETFEYLHSQGISESYLFPD